MTRKGMVVSNSGIGNQIYSVLTNNWQTSSIIASQIVFAPDAVARTKANYANGIYGKRTTANAPDSGIKAGLVARSLSTLCRTGKVEKRKMNNAKTEYRLAQPKD